MKNRLATLILFIFLTQVGTAQVFQIHKFTHLLGIGIVSDRPLEDSWISIENDTVKTHILSSKGNITEQKYPIVRWIEWDDSSNKSLEIGEKIVVLASDESELEFTYNQDTRYDGVLTNYLSLIQPYTNSNFRYDVLINLQDQTTSENKGSADREPKQSLISTWEKATNSNAPGQFKLDVYYSKKTEYPLTAIMNHNGEVSEHILQIDDDGTFVFYNPSTLNRQMTAEMKIVNGEYSLFFDSGFLVLVRTFSASGSE